MAGANTPTTLSGALNPPSATGPGPAVVWAAPAADVEGLEIRVQGRLRRDPALDEALDTVGADDATAVGQAYLRYGPDAFARLGGAFAAALWDPDMERLLLYRSPPAGAAPAIFIHRHSRGAAFSTRRADLPPCLTLHAAPLSRWVEAGLWPHGVDALGEVETVRPGQLVTVTGSGRRSDQQIWTFSPMAIPRGLSPDDARAELDAALARRLDGLGPARLWAEPPFRSALARWGTAEPDAPISVDDEVLAGVAAHAEHPIALSGLLRLARVAQLEPGSSVVSDFGGDAAFGGSPAAVRAWLDALARAVEATPRPGLTARVIRVGAPMDRAARAGVLWPQLGRAGAEVLRRWSRHVPPNVAEALVRRLPDAPEPDPGLLATTGDPFVDQRFAELTDASLVAEHQAAIQIAQARQSEWVAPLLERSVVELAFSVPVPSLIGDGRVLKLFDGGRAPAPESTPGPWGPLARRWKARAEATLGLSPVPEDDPRADRLAGLGAFCAHHAPDAELERQTRPKRVALRTVS